MTYTPRPNLQRDKIARMQQQINELSSTKTLRSASIGSGGITVSDGGGITIADQGILEVDDGGIIIARHLNGQRAFFVGPSVDEQSYAFLVENPDGWGMIRYYTLADNSSYVYLGHETGRPRITAWGNNITLDATDFLVLAGTDQMSLISDHISIFDAVGQTGRISRGGGSNTATLWKGGDGLACTMRMQNNFAVHFMDGAEGAYIDVHALNFVDHAPSSEEVKNDLGELEEGALQTVQSVPVHRWTYIRPTAQLADGTEVLKEEEPVERIGPFAEEVTPDMGLPDAENPEDRNVSLSKSFWILWKAVQELSAKVEEQETTINDLQQRLEKAGI